VTRRVLTWLLAIMLAIPLAVLAAVGLVAGTEAGTRWLLEFVEPRLPEALTIGDSSGTLLGGIAVSRVSWDDEVVRVEVTGVELTAALLPLLDRQLRITRLRADSLSVEVRQRSGPLPARDPGPFSLELPFDLHIDDAVLEDLSVTTPALARNADRLAFSANLDRNLLFVRQLELASNWLDLTLDGNFRLGGRYSADATAAWSFRGEGAAEAGGRLTLDGNWQAYRVAHELTTPFAMTSAGSVNLEGGRVWADLTHRWQSIEWRLGDRAWRTTAGRLDTRGMPDDFDVGLVAGVEADGLPRVDVDLTANADLNGAEIETLEIAGEPGRIALSGLVEWRETAEFDLIFEANDLDPASLWSRLDGRIDASGQAIGRLADGAPEVNLAVESLGGSLLGQPLSGVARLGIVGRRIEIDDASLALGDNRLSAAGVIDEALDLEGELDLGDLSQLDARASGTLSAGLTISGDPGSPSIVARFEADNPAWNVYRAGALTGTARLSPERSLATDVTFSGLSAGSITVDTTSVGIEGDVSSHRFSLTMNDADGSLELRGDGSVVDDRWQARLATVEVTTAGLGDWALTEPLVASVGADSINLSRSCLASRSTSGRVCFETVFSPATGGRLDADVDGFPLAALPLELPAGASVRGLIEANVDARLADGVVGGGADIRILDGAIEATYEDEPYALEFTTAALRADIEQNRLDSSFEIVVNNGEGTAQGEIRIDDVTAADAPIVGRGDITVPDTSIFSVFVPDISNPAGRINGSLSVGGTLAAPDFGGDVRLEDGAFDVRMAGIRITDMNLRLTQRDAGRLTLSGSARSGPGSVSIEGGTTISDETGLGAEIRINGENFELARLPDWRLSASPDIDLVLDDSTASVSGSLEVPEANITLKSIPETASRPSPDVTVHGSTQAGNGRSRRVDIDVDVRLSEEVRLSGFGLTTGVAGAVRIRGGSRRFYTGNGRLTLLDGRYKAYGQNLEIESGELIFNGPLDNPRLNVRAVRRIPTEDVVAGIRLTGTPRQLSSEVFSEPAMGDAEALSYLLTGRALSSAGQTGDADFLNQAAFALGLSQAGSIASQIQGDLGLDTLKVEGGSESGRIVAGKRFGDRLLVEYGYGLIDKLGTLLLRYQLTNRLMLESRTGTVSELDIVYTVREK